MTEWTLASYHNTREKREEAFKTVALKHQTFRVKRNEYADAVLSSVKNFLSYIYSQHYWRDTYFSKFYDACREDTEKRLQFLSFSKTANWHDIWCITTSFEKNFKLKRGLSEILTDRNCDDYRELMWQPSDVTPFQWSQHKTFSAQLQLYKSLKFENDFINTQLQEELCNFLWFLADFYALNKNLTELLHKKVMEELERRLRNSHWILVTVNPMDYMQNLKKELHYPLQMDTREFFEKLWQEMQTNNGRNNNSNNDRHDHYGGHEQYGEENDDLTADSTHIQECFDTDKGSKHEDTSFKRRRTF